MSFRELSLGTNEAVFPQYIGGVQHWVSPEVNEIVRKLHEGAPELAWPGDPRLALYHNERESRWELWRLEADEEMRLFCRSKPGAKLDDSIIIGLVEHDTRHGFDPVAYLESQTKAQQDIEDEQVAVLSEVMQKVIFEGNKGDV